MRVLAFGAHPDDIEECMGGTLAKHAAQGDEIFMCIATNGEIGSCTMSREAQESCAIIGAHLIRLGFEDEMLFDCRETRMAFIDAVRQARPTQFIHPRNMPATTRTMTSRAASLLRHACSQQSSLWKRRTPPSTKSRRCSGAPPWAVFRQRRILNTSLT